MYCNIRVFIMIIPSVHFVCLHGYHFRMLCCPYRLPVVRALLLLWTLKALRVHSTGIGWLQQHFLTTDCLICMLAYNINDITPQSCGFTL